MYFPYRCLNIVMTDFYMACHIIKQGKKIVPIVSNNEIKEMMAHLATLSQICYFRQSRFRNLV